jgi:methylmalonyl-CoA mutase
MDLFEEFKEVSHQDWLNQITADLKGKNFEDNLVWQSIEGINVQPFYNKSTLPANINTPLKHFNVWKIRETITITSPKESNTKALIALKYGVNSLAFIGKINSSAEMSVLLKDIIFDIVDLHFYNSNPTQTQQFLTELYPNIIFKGSVSYDYLGEFLSSGNWNKEEALSQLISSTQNTSVLKTVTVKGINFCNAGSTIVQELAFSLAQGVEYLSILTDSKITAKEAANKMQFHFGIGSNYFFEIAKLKAARKLWMLILEQYKVENEEMYIHSETSSWNISNIDSNINMLRATTEAMSAIIGGCNSLSILPFDNFKTSKNSYSERVAINIQHILKEESFLDKVKNPADGSYYIEQLTDEIAQKSWSLFQKIEQNGGFIACIENNLIQSEIKAIADKKNEAIKNGQLILVGTNKYPNIDEEIDPTTFLSVPQNLTTKTIINPLPIFRASQEIENEHAINA